MSVGVFLAVMVAALLHAGWNALIRSGLRKRTSMFLLSVGHGIIGLALLPFFPVPPVHVWGWLVASALIHVIYQLFLAYAYEQGDLSRVYPIARGAAPMLVLGVSVVALADQISRFEVLGIAVVGLGIALMAAGALRSGESRRLLPYALGAACATAGYTLTDGLGARAWGLPVAYIAWQMVLAALLYAPIAGVMQGRGVMRADARTWMLGMVAAAASFTAYAIAVWAMTQAPIAVVGALRETSILFAVLIGWWFFRERMDAAKIIAAGLIVAGVMLTRF